MTKNKRRMIYAIVLSLGTGILIGRFWWGNRIPEFAMPGGYLPSNGHIQTMEPIILQIPDRPHRPKAEN